MSDSWTHCQALREYACRGAAVASSDAAADLEESFVSTGHTAAEINPLAAVADHGNSPPSIIQTPQVRTWAGWTSASGLTAPSPPSAVLGPRLVGVGSSKFRPQDGCPRSS